jgi:hypothetical protein
MILKNKLSLFGFLLILLSCSERPSFEQDIFLEISDRKKFHIGESGLVPDFFRSVSLDSSQSKGVIFNDVVHSLDSIFISQDSAWIKEGDFIHMEGPEGVGTIFSFFTAENHVIFMNAQQFFRKEKISGTVQSKFMHEYGVFGNLKYPGISVNSTSFSPEFNAYDKKTDTGYLIYVEDNRISVMGYKPGLDSMFILPINLDSANFFNLRFKVRTGGLTLLGDDQPQLSIVDSKLIVSYPSFSDFLVYDLESGNHQIFTSNSDSFPLKRNPPKHFGNESVDVDSFELLKLWNKEVRFGPISYLKDHNKFIRFVKGEYAGEEQANAPIFLEVFSDSFEKLKEFDLSSLNSDLRPQYLNTPYGLMLRAKTQPEEDVMYYYYLNLHHSK